MVICLRMQKKKIRNNYKKLGCLEAFLERCLDANDIHLEDKAGLLI